MIGMAEVMPPPVPVTVMVAMVPTGTVPAMLKVTVALAPVTTLGLRVAVTPVGRPLTLNVTGLVKPLAGLIEIVLLMLVPATALMLSGFAARVKVGLPEGAPWKVFKTFSAGFVRGL